MRIFIALKIPEDTKTKIAEIIKVLKDHAVKGRFVDEKLLHITLEFLGELTEQQLTEVIEIVKATEFKPVSLMGRDIGFFKGAKGNTWWLGFEENQELMDLQTRLRKSLKDHGYKLENRTYRPHLTLGRKVSLSEVVDLSRIKSIAQNIEIRLNEMDVMRSEGMGDQLTYTPKYCRLAIIEE